MLEKTNDIDVFATVPKSFDFDGSGAVRASSPVLPAAAGQMNIDVVVNKDSAVWIVHDRPLPDTLEWVEFDVESKIVTLITPAGKLQDVGLLIHPPMDVYVARARQVCVVQMRDKDIQGMILLPLIVRDLNRKKEKTL